MQISGKEEERERQNLDSVKEVDNMVDKKEAAPPNKAREMAQGMAQMVQDFEPLLDTLGIDKSARGKIVVSLITKGKLPGGLMQLFGGKDSRTRIEKFWDGMASGLPFILALYGLVILTALLHRWGVI